MIMQKSDINNSQIEFSLMCNLYLMKHSLIELNIVFELNSLINSTNLNH